MKTVFSILKPCIVICLSVLILACAGKTTRFNNEDPSHFDMTRGGPVKAEACGFQLLSIIPIATNDRQQRAVNDLHNRGDYYFGEIRVQEYWAWALLGTVHCTKILATAYPRL